MHKEHPVVAPPSHEDPHAHNSDSDYSLDTDESPHSVDSYQLSAEDDNEEDNDHDHSSNSNLHIPQLHKAQTSPATSSMSARDLDGDVDDFFVVEPERRSPSPRLADDHLEMQREEQEQEQEQGRYSLTQSKSSPLSKEKNEQALGQAHIEAHSGLSIDSYQPTSSSAGLVFPTLTPPQSPHAPLASQPATLTIADGDNDDHNKPSSSANTETAVPVSVERPRTVQQISLPRETEDDKRDNNTNSNNSSSSESALSSPPATPVQTKISSISTVVDEITDSDSNKTTTTTKKEHSKGGILPPPVDTSVSLSTASPIEALSTKTTTTSYSDEESGPERGPFVPSNQSRPRSSSLISGAPRSPRTPKSVAFAPDVKDPSDDRIAGIDSNDTFSSDSSSDEEDAADKELHAQEFHVLLLGTARNTHDIAKTCNKIRSDLRRMSRHTKVHITTRFDRQVDKNEFSEFDLCVYFIQALGAQPQDAELLLDIVQRTATLVIISSHNTAPLSRQVAIDTRRHLGVYLNKAMPRLPLFRNPFRAARLSQDYESDAELILRNAVSMRELPRISIVHLLETVRRDPIRARFTSSSWDWPSFTSILFGFFTFIVIPYLSYIAYQYSTRPKPPAHALVSNLSYDIKNGFATCSLDLRGPSGYPYRSKEPHPFIIRILHTGNDVTTVESDAFQFDSSNAIHHTFTGGNKQVVLVNTGGMGLESCHSESPQLYLHIWFQNGTRVPGTPMKLALPDDLKNCPTPPPATREAHKEEPPTLWEKVQRVITSNESSTQGSTKTPQATTAPEKQKDAENSRQRVYQDDQWIPKRPQKQKQQQQQQQQQRQQRQQQQRSERTEQSKRQHQHQHQKHESMPTGDEYDSWIAGSDWAARFNQFSSAVAKQIQSADLARYVSLAIDEMLGAFQDMYQFCHSASYALRDMMEDVRENVQHFFSDLCDDTYPVLKQVRRSSHKYKKAVRQSFQCYYDQFKAKLEKQDPDHRLRRLIQERVASAKRTLERGLPLPIDRFAGMVDQAILDADARVQALMKARTWEEALERWEKMQQYERQLRSVERQMSEDPRFARMDRRTRRKHAIQMMLHQGYWIPGDEPSTLLQQSKEQWRSFRRRFSI
ncbi:hypothetical protein BGW42_006769 [Actinomortierella wolfii]|nr:hypothetical protein BGW42_006769 [Actinomortierella wolfii]